MKSLMILDELNRIEEGLIALTKEQRKVFQLTMEETRQKLSIKEFSLLFGSDL